MKGANGTSHYMIVGKLKTLYILLFRIIYTILFIFIYYIFLFMYFFGGSGWVVVVASFKAL